MVGRSSFVDISVLCLGGQSWVLVYRIIRGMWHEDEPIIFFISADEEGGGEGKEKRACMSPLTFTILILPLLLSFASFFILPLILNSLFSSFLL